jgi:sec-independent protein translocase protein TatC
VAEPFLTTFTLSAYAAILISLPVLLYQLYAFILPAFTPGERRVAMPLLMMVPFLFIAGVVFGYYVVLPAALKFLLHFNTDQFRIEIRAKDYYGFVSMTLIACGLLFQIPVGILGLNRLGIVTPRQLRKNRRYAILVIAVVAMLLPGVDPVTMLIEMVPMIVLYELSILLAVAFGRSSEPASDHVISAEG